jgi:hypothetical protein
MRKIASAAGVILLLGTACLFEARAQLGGDKFKESNASDSYTRGYLEVFGRPPLPKESQYWRKQQMPYSQMINEMKAWLRKPEGAQDLSETIERSYQNSFGRAPKPEELAYWQAEVKAKHYGYTHLIEHSRQWLKGGGAAEREPLIKRAYEQAFGRNPTGEELSYWQQQIGKDGTNYSELVEKCIDWMLGSSPEQIAELKGTIKRAYLATKRPAPSDAQTKHWMVQASAKRLTYQLLVILVPKSNV